MKALTIKELTNLCLEEELKGNGDKEILISNDDEGNGYHSLFYGFTTDKNTLASFKEDGLLHDNSDINKSVILG